tara:strand:+ start:360 stop:575 length:216 start_codon:yes stop_codon:yes gene_type:complete
MKLWFTGRTKYPNTPETDMREEVLHIVEYTDNGFRITVEVMAKDPSDAINKIRNGEIENELDRKIQTEKSE